MRSSEASEPTSLHVPRPRPRWLQDADKAADAVCSASCRDAIIAFEYAFPFFLEGGVFWGVYSQAPNNLKSFEKPRGFVVGLGFVSLPSLHKGT